MGANYMSHSLFGDSLTAPHFSELFCVTGMTLLRYKISDGKDDAGSGSQGGSLAEKLIHDLGIGLLVTCLVSSDSCADLAELLVSMHAGMGSCVSMGDLGGTLLEGCVDEAQVGIVVCFGIHA